MSDLPPARSHSLNTHIEGYTKLALENPEAREDAQARHQHLLPKNNIPLNRWSEVELRVLAQ